MAYTVAFSLLASLFDSLTLVPVLTAMFLKPKKESKKVPWTQKIFQRTRPFFLWVDQHYQRLLDLSLSHKKVVVTGVIGVFAGTMFLVPLLGTDFFPSIDEGQLRMSIRLPVGSSLGETVKVVEKVEDMVFEEVPELKSLWARAGSGKGRGVIFSGRFAGTHTGNTSLMLVDQSERERPSDVISRAVREKVRKIPGAIVSIYPGGLISRMITFGNDDPIDVEILGYDLAAGSRLAKEVEEILRGVRGVTDIQVGREDGLPEYQVRVRQDRAAAAGLTTSRVAEIVRRSVEGTEGSGSSIYVDPVTGREHNVRVRLRAEDRKNPEDLRRIPLPVSRRPDRAAGERR